MTNNSIDIKMVALDLDGTTLNSRREITPRTREAFRRAMEKGVHIVVSTGRVWSSLPKELFHIEGLEYVITSNGATVTEMATRERIYENRPEGKAVEQIIEVVKDSFLKDGFSMDAFVDGRAYIDAREYLKIQTGGIDFRTEDYVMETRTPVRGLLEFMMEHKDQMENISLNFRYREDMERMRARLSEIPRITLTSSFKNNIEIGGATTSKADALGMLMRKLRIGRSQLMACGDSRNDLAMIRLAEVGVAMENGWDAIKGSANYVTDTNDNDGVAKAIEKFVLD